ncbi:hypothetical protein PHLCEN_2v10205 [Hermanssonia centrifuga]|nr:hypothetical protein PHLCEN_2v10205 [Hermanssonia centrifuga]
MSSETLPSFPVNAPPTYVANPHPGWSIGQKTESIPDGTEWTEGEEAGWTVMHTGTEDP